MTDIDARVREIMDAASAVAKRVGTHEYLRSTIRRHLEEISAELEQAKRESDRAMFAKDFMAAAIQAGHDRDMRGYEGWRGELAREAIRYADALIEEIANTRADTSAAIPKDKQGKEPS